MCRKSIDSYSAHLKKLLRIAVIYIVFAVIFVLVQYIRGSAETFDVKRIFAYPGYSWYIEMYFGLYLLMPFLNKLWQSLSEKQKHMLLAAMIIICVLPFAVNVKFKIMPNYFYPLWPFLYYFAGAWLREFRIPLNNKIKTAIALILPCVMGLVEIFVMKIAKPSAGGEGVLRYGGYQSLGVFISAMLLFEMLLRVRAEKLPRAVTKTISFITKYSIGIYLFSFFSDAVVYKIVNRLPDFSRKIVWWPVAFICSYAIAAVLSVIVTGCYDFAEKFVRRRLVAGKVQKS